MLVKSAEEQVRGLTQPQKQRLVQYRTSLSKDRDLVLFDKNLEELVIRFAKDPETIKSDLEYLRGIGFNQSQYTYAHLEKGLKNFQGNNHANFMWNRNAKTAKGNIQRDFETWGLRSLQYQTKEDIEDAITRKDAHAGFTYINTGYRTKGENLDGLLSEYSKAETKARKEGSFNTPILVGSRIGASNFIKEDGSYNPDFVVKSRLISMIDNILILAETKFARPIQNKMSEVSWYAGGKDDPTVNGILSQWRGMYGHRVTIDYSAYDQSISDWLIREAFDIMRAAFRHDSSFDDEIFTIVREDFITKVFIDGEGKLRQSNKGVPSGSMFTSIVDSIVNRLIIETYLLAFPKGDKFNFMIMGDDNIIFTKEEVDLVHLSSYISKNFGIIAHPDKCSKSSTTETPEFLSRYWTYDGVWREPKELLAKLCYPERFRDYNFADPGAILVAYIHSFPRGMEELIDIRRAEEEIMFSVSQLKDNVKWLDSLMQYKLRFLGARL